MSNLKNSFGQQRTTYQKFREFVSPVRQVSEFMDPELYGDAMGQLRLTDDNIRTLAEPLNKIKKDLKKAYRSHRYLKVIELSSELLKILRSISLQEQFLKKDRSEKIKDFYFDDEDIDEDIGSYVESIREKTSSLNKQAGIFDIFSPRDRGEKMLSKVYKNKIRQMKLAMKEIYNMSVSTIDKLMKIFSTLGDHRAVGEFSDYVKEFDKIVKMKDNYQEKFLNIYDKHVADMLPKKEKKSPEKEEEETSQEELVVEEDVAAPAPRQIPQTLIDRPSEALPSEVTQPMEAVPMEGPPMEAEPVSSADFERSFESPPGPYMGPEDSPEGEPAERKKGQPFVSTSSGFFSRMIKLALMKNDFAMAGRYASKYSQFLENQGDIDSSIKALAMARKWLNE